MRIAGARDELDPVLRVWRRERLRIALVPTMGNLHEGHLTLVRVARAAADRVVASIYVNPTQFGEGEDFERYPRTFDRDRALLQQAGCDLVFAPETATLYPRGLANAVRVIASPDLSTVLEGASRPGHFDGVVSVVARLFNLVNPDLAVFGEKDWQQLVIIRRMVLDLGYDIEILGVPTVREPGGLAMSSRNAYLAAGQREAAVALNGILEQAAERIRNGETDFAAVEGEAAGRLATRGLKVDYCAVRCSSNLAVPEQSDRDLRVLAAVWCGDTRLIDNVFIKQVGISGI